MEPKVCGREWGDEAAETSSHQAGRPGTQHTFRTPPTLVFDILLSLACNPAPEVKVLTGLREEDMESNLPNLLRKYSADVGLENVLHDVVMACFYYSL